jgi:hypothetical protein
MRFKFVCTSAAKLPAAIVSSATAATMPVAWTGKMNASGIMKPNAAALVPVAISVVTGVGAPWYTSGTHRWNGKTETLKNRPAINRPAPARKIGVVARLPLEAAARPVSDKLPVATNSSDAPNR